MKERMIGRSRRIQVGMKRVPINIEPGVREQLRTLLFGRDMFGVGYSEFIARAITIAKEEIEGRKEALAAARQHYHEDPKEFHHDCKGCHAEGLTDRQLRADLFGEGE